MDALGGRVAVVTGAGSGIGRALAVRFAAEGMRLALADVEADALAETATLAGGAFTRVVDVRDEQAVRGFADAVFAELGTVDVLCNNAGVFCGGGLWTRPSEDFAWVVGVNLDGVLNGIRAFVPRMLAQGADGHVVNTSSSAGLFAAPFTGPYTISKFGVFAATEALAHELRAAGSRIGVSVLCPGGVRTNLAGAARNRPDELGAERTDDQAFVEQVMADTMAAGATPEQVADAVVTAVLEDRFLILTDPAHEQSLRDRTEALLAGRLPALPDF